MPAALAMRGLPFDRTTARLAPFRGLMGVASLAPDLAFVPVFGGDLDFVADLSGVLARDVRFAFGLALPGMRTESGGAFMVMAAPRGGS